jgi:hypothetical protein
MRRQKEKHPRPAAEPAAAVPLVAVETRHGWAMWLLLVLALAYAIAWVALASPFRTFPSDDTRFWPHMTQGSLLHVQTGYEPVTELSMRAFYQMAQCFWKPTQTLMVAFVEFCYLGVMLAMGLVVRRLTGEWLTALGAVLLFAVSAWPVTYVFFISYTPLAALCTWAGWCFLLYLPAKPLAGKMLAVLSAVAATACVGTSAAGTIAVLGLGWLALGLWWFGTPRANNSESALRESQAAASASRQVSSRQGARNWLLALWFFIPLLLGLGWLALVFGKDYHAHVAENIATEHYKAATAKFGSVPKVPFFSGLWVLSNYSLILAAAFVAGTLALLVSVVRSGLNVRSGAPDKSRRMLLLIASALWLEAIAIDLLPTTKLGRAHFVWFPGVCVFLALCVRWLICQVAARGRWLVLGLAIVLAGGAAAEGISRSATVCASRLALPRNLEARHPVTQTVLLLDRDPHAMFMAKWLAQWQIGAVTLENLVKAAQSGQLNDPHLVLLVGPTGDQSGNSILMHGCLPDFPLPVDELARQTGAHAERFPYYAYVPAFCLEEEICEGLVYAGKVPLPANDGAKNITLLSWPAATEPKPLKP